MRLAIVLLLSSLASAQGMGGKSGIGGKAGFGGGVGACTTPTGTNFTDSLGDSATLCWAAGPSQCGQTWTIGGTPASETIISSPASAPANTACANSLQLVETTAVVGYLSFPYTALTAATNYDVIFTFQVTSDGTTNGNATHIECTSTAGNGCNSSAVWNLTLAFNSPNYQLIAEAATSSSLVTISLNAWHTVDIHHDATLASCSMTVDGGAPQTFTCNGGSSSSIFFGDQHAASQGLTLVVGDVYF